MAVSKYITHVQCENTDGYQVRLPTCNNGEMLPNSKETVSKLFSVSLYKSRESCKRAAATWRNRYLREHNCLHFLKNSPRFNKPITNSGRNTSGAIGVTHTVDVKSNDLFYGYKACWSEDIKNHGCSIRQTGKQFSCIRYGEKEAFKMACALRYEKKGVIIITDTKAIPCYPDVPYLIKEKQCA